MEIKRPAIAGTLESSDCQVMVEAGEGKIDLSLDSAVINQYGNQIRKVVLETLDNLGVDDVKIKARVEGAIFRSVKQLENLPWGGAIR